MRSPRPSRWFTRPDDELVFSDLKDGLWWEWTQGRWVELGNPLTREVGP